MWHFRGRSWRWWRRRSYADLVAEYSRELELRAARELRRYLADTASEPPVHNIDNTSPVRRDRAKYLDEFGRVGGADRLAKPSQTHAVLLCHGTPFWPSFAPLHTVSASKA